MCIFHLRFSEARMFSDSERQVTSFIVSGTNLTSYLASRLTANIYQLDGCHPVEDEAARRVDLAGRDGQHVGNQGPDMVADFRCPGGCH
jgi:hypothetical protein